MSCFVCIVLPYLDIFLIFRLSPVAFGLFSRVVFFTRISFSFLPQHVPEFFCRISFVCCRKFLICVSRRNYHPGFKFLFLFFRGTPISSQTNFIHAEISSLNSVMSFVEICITKSFFFLVSDLTVLQSMCPRDGNVVFFSFISLLKFSSFISYSCVSVCFMWVWLCGSSIVVGLLFISVRFYLFVTIWWVDYCISVILVDSLFFLLYSLYSMVKKRTFLYYDPNLVIKSLVCCLKACAFFSNLYHPFPLLSFFRVTPKITEKWNLVVFPSPCFVLLTLVCVVIWVIVCVPEKRTASICRMRINPICWLLGERLPIMTPRPVAWVSRCVIFQCDIFVIGSILWLYLAQVLFKMCTPVTDVTKFSLISELISGSHRIYIYIYRLVILLALFTSSTDTTLSGSFLTELFIPGY